ncbi:hypothetical protein BDZ89DRAFT_1117908, partial [Hymenopellis radicata]
MPDLILENGKTKLPCPLTSLQNFSPSYTNVSLLVISRASLPYQDNGVHAMRNTIIIFYVAFCLVFSLPTRKSARFALSKQSLVSLSLAPASFNSFGTSFFQAQLDVYVEHHHGRAV